MPSSSLELLRTVLGADLSPETIVAAARDEDLVKAQIRELYVDQRAPERKTTPAPRPDGHIRPVIHDLLQVITTGDTAERTLDTLTFPLLYGHSAAVPDVLDAQMDGTDDYDLAAVLHVYGALAPLYDSETLVSIPSRVVQPASFFEGMSAVSFLANRLRGEVESLPLSQRRHSGLWSLDRTEEWALVNWIRCLEVAAQTSSDPFPRSAPDLLAVRLLIETGAGDFSDRLVQTLVSQTTPDLRGLSASDILSVRESGEFEDWRSELSSALADLDGRVKSGYVTLGRAEFSDRFRTKAEALERMTLRSRFLTEARGAARTFVLTLAGLGLAAPVIGGDASAENAVIAGAAASADLLVQLRILVKNWMDSAAPSPALARHYGVFVATTPLQ